MGRKDIEELIEARELLALGLAGMAAERASAEDVEHLRGAVERMQESAADAAVYPEADIELHHGLARAASTRFQFSVDAHGALVDAIEAGEADLARSILFDLMSRHHEFVLGLYALAPDEVESA